MNETQLQILHELGNATGEKREQIRDSILCEELTLLANCAEKIADALDTIARKLPE